MSDETVQQKAERQTRLSHAMGVMFLQDKVDKLEQDVSKITYPRGVQKPRSTPNAHARPDAAVQQLRAHPRAATGPGIAATTRDSDSTAKKVATSIRLVDASVLIFSLRSVHNWSRDQSTCVVIPLEAINTLDLLKKGDEPINLAARKATRWLEDKIAVSTQDGDAMLTEPVPGIFAQKEHFRVSSTQMAKARQARLDQHHSDAADQDNGDAIVEFQHDPSSTIGKDHFNASEAPRYLRELLSVCLYCQGAATTASNYAVAIAYPPHHLDETMIEAQSATNDKPTYLNRTDGRATEAWLDAYQIPFEVVPTSKTWTGEKPSSRFRGDIVGDQHTVSSADDPVGSMPTWKGQSRRRASPTPSVSSSTSSFKSELSGLSMLGSHKSPRLRYESRFSATTTAPLRSVRCMSTSTAGATASSSTETAPALLSSEDSTDEDGPIIARPSSAASSHTSFVSSLTTLTQDDWSGSSHCGSRIVRHASSPAPVDASTAAATSSESLFTASPRLTSRTLHKTKSGAEKMEEYLRRLEAGVGGGADRRMDSSTPTPRNG